jgi:hypothetical protein
LAITGCQGNKLSWRDKFAKEIYILGGPNIFLAHSILWQSNSQGNNPWQSAAKVIEFPWLFSLGGFCLAVGYQGQLPWRFSYISWRFLAAKAIPFSSSDTR